VLIEAEGVEIADAQEASNDDADKNRGANATRVRDRVQRIAQSVSDDRLRQIGQDKPDPWPADLQQACTSLVAHLAHPLTGDLGFPRSDLHKMLGGDHDVLAGDLRQDFGDGLALTARRAIGLVNAVANDAVDIRDGLDEAAQAGDFLTRRARVDKRRGGLPERE